MKYKITKIDKEMFFLKLGAIVILDFNYNRVYDENRDQYMPLDIALKTGMDGEQI